MEMETNKCFKFIQRAAGRFKWDPWKLAIAREPLVETRGVLKVHTRCSDNFLIPLHNIMYQINVKLHNIV